VTGRRIWLAASAALLIVAVAAVARNQVKVRRGRVARALAMQQRHPVIPLPADVVSRRQVMFDMLQPVGLSNCQLERFGERNDGGYLMCANLLEAVQSGYSYGINGYDKWGCDISTRTKAPLHQYDCFNTDVPSCRSGNTVFHAECVGDAAATIDGRPFDTVKNQMANNGDAGKRIVMKIDVEGAEWPAFLTMPEETLALIDQLSVEFHWEEDAKLGWLDDPRYVQAVERLKRFFEVGYIHYNNASCIGDLKPFPSWAFEVLFVSKRIAVVDPARSPARAHPQEARNNASLPDCQAGGR
jgi:hypothetical protein